LKPKTIDSPSQESRIQHQESSSRFSIQVEDLSKRFNREWVFKDLNYVFQSGKTYAITGPNGSGKSTLLQILWGQLPQTSGTITYSSRGVGIPNEEIFSHLSIATPYMDLIDEFTLREQLQFHFKMRAISSGFTIENIIDKLYLADAKDKNISNFSSGMKQRLKLGLAFFTESSILFLDEPGTNLDDRAFQWYNDNLAEVPKEKLILIATNQKDEYPEEAEIVDLRWFK
jgi:ABC-type multidrug transport system ATPase subunit